MGHSGAVSCNDVIGPVNGSGDTNGCSLDGSHPTFYSQLFHIVFMFRHLNSLSLLISWTCALSGSTALWAQQKVLPDFLASWQDVYRHRTVADLAAVGLYTRHQDSLGGAFNFGLDHYARWSNDTRDIATINMQLYLSRFEDHPKPPPFADGPNDWEFTPRINTINWHVSGDGRFNIKMGHFEMPYGIEHTINSNGTLRQFSTGPNLGTKVDWGVTFNGTFPKFLYEIGVGRGSGMDFESMGDPHLVVGRIGSPVNTQNFWGTGETAYGLSFYQRNNATGQERWRVGLDGQHYIGPLGLLGEISAGEDEKVETYLGLIEVNLSNSAETLLAYTQYRWQYKYASSDWEDGSSVTLGVRYAPSDRWAFSTQYNENIRDLAPARDNYMLSLQARLRY